jgi:hypothetical protein
MGRRYGTSTAGIETSPRYRRKQAKRRSGEEARWAAMAGPVETRQVDPTPRVAPEIPDEAPESP